MASGPLAWGVAAAARHQSGPMPQRKQAAAEAAAHVLS